MKTVQMFICNGYQDVAAHSQKRVDFPIRTTEVPAEHAHAVMGFTDARNESLEDLIEGLKQAAGVTHLRYKLVDDRA